MHDGPATVLHESTVERMRVIEVGLQHRDAEIRRVGDPLVEAHHGNTGLTEMQGHGVADHSFHTGHQNRSFHLDTCCCLRRMIVIGLLGPEANLGIVQAIQ